MRLKQATIKNLRLFGNSEQRIVFSEDKNITVFLGDNGAGKTSILYGLSVILSNFFRAFPGIGIKNFTDRDVRIVNATRLADYLQVGIDLSVPQQNEPITAYQNRKGDSSDTPKSYLSELNAYGNAMKEKLDNNECVEMPILAYYGTERGQIDSPERRRDFNTVFPRWDAYTDALEPSTNFKRFFTWYERNEDEERRKKLELMDFGYRSFVLEVVRRALNQVDRKYRNPRVLTSPLRFVMDDISNNEQQKEIRIEQMSDGFRIMVAMIADIAARMAEVNPSIGCSGLSNVLETPGIVFIDEIDLHLHPLWQRKVLRQLNSIFPNVQFIVTTHSPNVVMGALDLVQVIKLDNGIIDTAVDINQYIYYDINQMLLSDLFNVGNVRRVEYETLYNERSGLIHKADNLTAAEQTRLNELDRQIAKYDPCEGGEMRRVRELLEQLSQSSGQ